MFAFDAYQTWTDTTAVYPYEQRRLYPLLGLAEEAGEVLGVVKKAIRNDEELPVDKLRDELGDTLYYLARVAKEHGLTLSEVALRNIEKLEERKQHGKLKRR
jgi:NTP pyrophosphatase (non-canonical NTP hydrolase)